MEPNVVNMLVNESEILLKKEKAKKLVTIPSSHSRNKNSMKEIT
jgi:septum formation inhibitor-activating ATPase MinD